MSTATINIQTDNDIKMKAQQIFSMLGMDMATAINLFLHQTVRMNDMPFILTTRKTLAEQTAQTTVTESKLPYGFGCMKEKMWMSDDFDAPLDDFAEYM